VSLSGRLEAFPLPALLHTLDTRQLTGKLTLTRADGQALLVFRSGRIIYAASSSVRETFGSILVCRGLISEPALLEALERQHSSGGGRRLGSVLVELGLADEKTLREVMKQQTEGVLGELVRWQTGFFNFQPLEITPGGEVEVDVKDFLVTEGFDWQELVGPRPSGPLPPAPDLPTHVEISLGSITTETHAPAFTAEIALRLMRYAAQILNRGVLFLAVSDEVRGIGQFGVHLPGRSPADQVRSIVIPLGETSVLAEVVRRQETLKGPLAKTRWNRHLIDQLGGQEPLEAMAVPMIVGGAVNVVLYGDNLPEAREIGPLDALEFLMGEAAREMERALRP
jgi:hypothetical protein